MLFNVIYGVALILVSPLVVYRMIRFGRYRQGIGEKLFGLSAATANSIRGDSGDVIWLHAVSVGEVQLLPELARRLQLTRPDAVIAVSSSTDSGMAVARQHFGETVFFCPLDFTWAVRRTLRHLRPNDLILMELELWPNLIRLARDSRCAVTVANARMSESSCRQYARIPKVLTPTFGRLSAVGCQDEPARDRFIRCGVPAENVTVTGSLKFDNAALSRESTEVTTRVNWSGADPWHRVWCVGSTQSGEESMAIEVYDALRDRHPELRLILVPRHAERFDEVARLIQRSGHRLIRRSRRDSQYDDVWESDEILLVDTIGELRAWWGVAQIATVGGSFGSRGGQNMIEPAGYGCAVSFGPNTKNFALIADALIDAGGAVRVQNGDELRAFVEHCLDDPPAADAIGRVAQKIVHQHRGAHDKTLAMMNRSAASPPSATADGPRSSAQRAA